MELDNFELDDAALKDAEEKREAKLVEDEKPVIADEDDCEGCKI